MKRRGFLGLLLGLVGAPFVITEVSAAEPDLDEPKSDSLTEATVDHYLVIDTAHDTLRCRVFMAALRSKGHIGYSRSQPLSWRVRK